MDIKYLYENTELTIQQIADHLGSNFAKIHKYVADNYSSAHRKARKVNNYRKSKLGNKNPQFGKRGDETHNYVGDVADGKGYLMRLKPDWYTGRKGSRHVFVHQVVACENLSITEMPKGFCVHHCDFNPHNNDFSNLVLLTMGDHMRLHRYLAGATTISKESTLKWVETYGTPFKRVMI